MAPPPSKRPINTEDIPDAPEWLEKLVSPVNAFIVAAGGALDKGITFREQFAGQVKSVDITPPEEWVTATLSAGWAHVTSGTAPRPLQYRKTLDGKVEFRGRVTFPTGTPATSAPIVALPLGYAPDKREVFDCFGGVGTPSILSAYDGFLRWESGGSTNLSVSGDTWWMAADRTPPRWETPITIKLGAKDRVFPGRPGTVTVLNARQKQAPLGAVAVQAVDCVATTVDGSPAVHIWRVWGLAPGVAYSVTFGIFPE